MMVEACFFGGVMEQCEGIPNAVHHCGLTVTKHPRLMFSTGEMKVWMSNRFTSTFIEQITDNKDVAIATSIIGCSSILSEAM